ncbi:transposase [Sphingomonas sp. Ant20]|uniref:transposase n=1 Tax=Sphingomonas sp. Ant20 TaxID=104605 RepID=UPI0027407CC4|nr:transposase [Sphingomonas sp. Ant20]
MHRQPETQHHPPRQRGCPRCRARPCRHRRYVHARRRRKRIERVFGHLKRNLGLRTLKLRGLAGAAEEFSMAAAAYNLQLLARQAAPA